MKQRRNHGYARRFAAVAGANITTIDQYTFYGCIALTTVNLPKSVTISSYAFRNCYAPDTAYLPAIPPILNKSAFINTYLVGGIMHCAGLTVRAL
jgi:hypothetical protein